MARLIFFSERKEVRELREFSNADELLADAITFRSKEAPIPCIRYPDGSVEPLRKLQTSESSKRNWEHYRLTGTWLKQKNESNDN